MSQRDLQVQMGCHVKVSQVMNHILDGIGPEISLEKALVGLVQLGHLMDLALVDLAQPPGRVLASTLMCLAGTGQEMYLENHCQDQIERAHKGLANLVALVLSLEREHRMKWNPSGTGLAMYLEKHCQDQSPLALLRDLV